MGHIALDPTKDINVQNCTVASRQHDTVLLLSNFADANEVD
jgi:hypothetical protein